MYACHAKINDFAVFKHAASVVSYNFANIRPIYLTF